MTCASDPAERCDRRIGRPALALCLCLLSCSHQGSCAFSDRRPSVWASSSCAAPCGPVRGSISGELARAGRAATAVGARSMQRPSRRLPPRSAILATHSLFRLLLAMLPNASTAQQQGTQRAHVATDDLCDTLGQANSSYSLWGGRGLKKTRKAP